MYFATPIISFLFVMPQTITKRPSRIQSIKQLHVVRNCQQLNQVAKLHWQGSVP
jgi:hypothetical protein